MIAGQSQYHGTNAKSAYVHFSPTNHCPPLFFKCASITPVTRQISSPYRSKTDLRFFSGW